MKDQEIINMLRPIARDFLGRKWRHIACIVYKNQIISFGRANNKTHTFAAKYGGKNGKSQFWHAETHAIYLASQRLTERELKKSTLYVVRMKYEGTGKTDCHLANSKPCRGCQRCIDEYQIGRTVYSISEDHFGVMLNNQK